MGAFGDYFGQALQGIGGLGLAQQQQQAALAAYAASGSAWNTATVKVSNVDFGDLYALGQPAKIAPRGKESAVEWLDRRVSEICVKL